MSVDIDKKKTILAVDDNPQMLTTIAGLLGSEYKVIAATNASIAMRAMDKFELSIFLLDVEMPGIDGYALASIIRGTEKYKNTPILFITSNATKEAIITAMSHGGNDYIVKPVNRDILLSKVKNYLR